MPRTSRKITTEFTYKNFSIVREDEHNLVLYENREKEVYEGGGRGKGPGVATGRMEPKKVFVGFYGKFSKALNEIVERSLEESSDIKEVANKVQELKEMFETIDKEAPKEEVEEEVMAS